LFVCEHTTNVNQTKTSFEATTHLQIETQKVEKRGFVCMLFGVLFVALVWGATNPFLRYYSQGVSGRGVGSDLRFLASRPGYLVSLLFNWSGSVLFYLLLRDGDLSVVSPLCNGLTFAITLICGRLFFQETISSKAMVGISLIVLGTAVMANVK
jgi:multidrug transporter EmrE-like cation transporter